LIFKTHFSSSAGNLYEVVATNGKRIIIDPGVTWKKLQKSLNYDLSNIVGALCTHCHADHSRCVENVMEAGIDVYASAETFGHLGVVHRKAITIEDRSTFIIADTFDVFSFALCHDVPILGFIVHDRSSREDLLFITDTFMVKQRFGLPFNIVAICCSYDNDILQRQVEAGEINETFAKRLLTSHMEVETTKSYIRDYCCLDKCTEIWLLHCSRDNLDAEKVRSDIESEFFTRTIIAGRR